MKPNCELELITYSELRMVCGGRQMPRTTINAPLSGAVKQTINAPLSNLTVNAPKGPVEMTWGAKTFWGDFSWTFKAGR